MSMLTRWEPLTRWNPIKEIEEKIMPKYGIGDYEGAAKIYANDFRPPAPKPGASNGAAWSFPMDLRGRLWCGATAIRESIHTLR